MTDKQYTQEPLWDFIILEAVEMNKSTIVMLEDDKKQKSQRFNFRALKCGPDVKTIKPGDFILNSLPIGACIFNQAQVYLVREQDVAMRAVEVGEATGPKEV